MNITGHGVTVAIVDDGEFYMYEVKRLSVLLMGFLFDYC